MLLWGNDFVKNKGEGCIFLLYGVFGVGKICIVECVVELINCFFIVFMSGDFSICVWLVEDYFNYFFEFG